MSDCKQSLPAVAASDTPSERPVMNKRVTRKEDGRSLIYYSFGERSEPDPDATGEDKDAATTGKKV
jgi:hypothetical protein